MIVGESGLCNQVRGCQGRTLTSAGSSVAIDVQEHPNCAPKNGNTSMDLWKDTTTTSPATPVESYPETRKDSSPPRTKKVFVVHRRDEVAKTSLEIFLHEIGLQPVVLHRQADEGMTIIEKFEKHSDVGYAFVLLTPDEIAYLVADEHKPDRERKKEVRARPNVIFEFGYFVAKLGRSRVCCLHTGNVSLPSDVGGVIYKRYDKSLDEVAYSIIKELRASGYAIG